MKVDRLTLDSIVGQMDVFLALNPDAGDRHPVALWHKRLKNLLDNDEQSDEHVSLAATLRNIQLTLNKLLDEQDKRRNVAGRIDVCEPTLSFVEVKDATKETKAIRVRPQYAGDSRRFDVTGPNRLTLMDHFTKWYRMHTGRNPKASVIDQYDKTLSVTFVHDDVGLLFEVWYKTTWSKHNER